MISYHCGILSTFRSGLIISSRLLLCVSFFTCLLSTVNAEESWNETLIDIYNKSICQQYNTCDLIDRVPPNLTDLRTRNCMCDDKCALYNDCCSDAHKSPLKVNKKFSCVKTSFDGHIYMVKSCPNSWNKTSVMKKCVDENGATSSNDLLLKTPVTSNESGITYGNVFCAICNQEKKYIFWNVGVNYEKVLSNVTMNSTGQNMENSNDMDPAELDKEIFSNLAFNKSGDLSWSSKVKNSDYWVRFRAVVPDSAKEIVRYCLPNVVQTCPNGNLCEASTSYVYSANKVYKNADCAACNNVSGKYEACFKRENNNEKELFYIPIEHEQIPKAPHCEEIPTDIAFYDLICKCSYEPTEEKCHISKFFSFSKHEFSHIDNRAIFLPKYDMEIPCTQYKVTDDDHIYICGTEPVTTRYERILEYIYTLATEILMKISIVCIILHLLLFSLILEMQNLLGKNLASFCVALLLAFIISEVDSWLLSCKQVAIGLHYFFLSCFSWTLVMSYDLWSSLYRASSKFRFANRKHDTKFLIYSAIAWILPLSIIGPAVYIEYSPSSFTGRDLRPVYGKNEFCFIINSGARWYFFVLPATSIFFVNICLFAHVAYYIYLSKRNSVNPDTRNNFSAYCKLGLLMGLTWSLGYVVYITNNKLISVLFSLVNTSLGIIIFCAFTLQRRTVTPLSQQNSRRRLLSRRVSSFLSTANMHTPSTSMSENSTDKRNMRMAPI